MESAQLILNVIMFIIIPCAIYVGRNWIKAYITSGVQHDFDIKLEELRSELRRKERQIETLQDNVLKGRANREAMLDKRRLEATERVWDAFIDLGPYKSVAAMMSCLNERAVFEQANDPKMQQFFQTIVELAPKITPPERLIDKEKLFTSPLAWAYFQACRSIIMAIYTNAKLLGIGLRDVSGLINKKPLQELLKTALPHQTENIENFDTHSYYFFLNELEKKLQEELLKSIEGNDQDYKNIEQASDIMAKVNRVDEEKFKKEYTETKCS